MGNWCSRASRSTQSSSTNLSFKKLTINDLPLLCNTLNSVASKCFDLGLQLGVDFLQIRDIEQNYKKCEDQLCEIISERLKQDSPLTWHVIVTALRALRIREYTLASKIERDHIHNLQPSTSVAPQVSTVSSVSSTSSSLMSAQTLVSVRGGEHSMNPQPMGPQHRGNYQPPIHYPPYSQARQFPGRVAQGTPQYGTHPPKDTPYIDVINQHSEILTETISGDLTFFINKFIELGFVTRTATANVLSQHGVGDGEKAGKLLSLLTAHYNRTRNKEKWFDKFVGVFSSEPAYEDLADMMTVASEKMRWSDFGSSVTVTEPLPQLGKSHLLRSPMHAFVYYIKICYKQCEIERNLDVLKWPPTPSKIYINLACIDWESVVSKEKADEYTRAMVEDGNVEKE